MIHVSTILGGLVRSGTPLDEIIGRADAMLDGDGMVATAQVLVHRPRRVELSDGQRRPPAAAAAPARRRGRAPLPEATHPPLGVGDGDGDGRARRRSRPGAVVLGYTDGLIERRGEPIDDGIEPPRRPCWRPRTGRCGAPSATVLTAMAPDGGDRGDDDVAIVVAQHSAPG